MSPKNFTYPQKQDTLQEAVSSGYRNTFLFSFTFNLKVLLFPFLLAENFLLPIFGPIGLGICVCEFEAA